MAILPEKWRKDLRGRSSPVRVEYGTPRPGVRRWYSRARRLGWPRWKALRGAITYGRV